MENGERSPGGSEIIRHGAPREREVELSGGDEVLLEGVEKHLEQIFGIPQEHMAIHEIISPIVHVDIHIVPPDGERNWTTLVTTGMAELPMRDDDAEYYGELVLALPPDWPLDSDSMEDERHYWPIRLLTWLARFPHEFETVLWLGSSMPNEDPPEPYAPGTELCGMVILPPLLTPEEFDVLTLSDGREVHFLAPYPVYEDEMQLKLDKGADELFKRLREAGVTELIDPQRPSVASRRRGFFRR